MEYGLKVKDSEGNIVKITPLVSSIIASGLYTSPSELNADNTYGFDIDLPGTSPIPLSKLTVICNPQNFNCGINVNYIGVDVGGGNLVYVVNYYASSALTYYTMSITEPRAMSIWTAGNQTPNDQATWDPYLSVVPLTVWLKPLTTTSFTNIRIFPACLTFFIDASTVAWVQAYTLHGLPSASLGVIDSNVCVIIKEWNY